jgi:hypothetical protein
VVTSLPRKTVLQLVFLATIPWGAVGDEPNRLGICAANNPIAESLAELLTIELSQDDSVELVERDRMRAIRSELHWATVLGAGAHQDRLELGRLVDADFLVWLTVVDSAAEGNETQVGRFVRLVISDCVYGARLRVEYAPLDSGELAEMCNQFAAVIRTTLGSLSRDVRCLVTVPPFPSQNLTRTYDSLQDGYALLLQMALIEMPGVAVLEVDEARSIRDELLIAGREIEAPAIPLFVQGEYETTGQAPDREVRLRIQVLSGEDAPETIEERMPLEEAPEFLRSQVVETILPRVTKGLQGPSREQQRRWLARRAELFSRLGSDEQAIALQETALLLDPRDAEQRLALLDETHRHYMIRGWERSLRAELRDEPKEVIEQRIEDAYRDFWERRKQHVEYLLRNRLVNPREAGYLIASTTDYWRRPLLRNYGSRGSSQCLEDQPRAEEFLWRMVPLIARLDHGVARGVVRRGFEEYYDHVTLQERDWIPGEQDSRWVTATARSLMKFRFALEPRGDLDPNTLEQLYRLLTEVAPRGTLPSSTLATDLYFAGHYSDHAYEFHWRLSCSGHPGAEAFGKIGLLRFAVFSKTPAHLDPAKIPDTATLIRDIQKLPPSLATNIGAASVEGYAMRLRGEIVDAPPRPKAPAPEPSGPQANRRHRVSFKPLPHATASWSQLINCSDRFDLMWSDEAVHVMPQGKEARTIYTAKRFNMVVPGVLQCRWDGRYIWVTTNREPRIVALAPDGTQVAKFGRAEGLPPVNLYSRDNLYPPLLVHDIGPGRLLAVGRFGQFGRNARGWFAELVADLDDPRVHVFHKLTKRPRSGLKEADDPEFIAPISALIEWPGSRVEDRRVLAVRAPDRGLGYDRPPLVIALPSLETSLANVPFRTPGGKVYRGDVPLRILENDQVLDAMDDGIYAFHMSRGWSVFVPRRVLLRTKVLSRNSHLLRYQDDLLYAGRQWYRINPSSLRIESLTDGPLPEALDFEHYAVSTSFGLVAWNQDEPLHRVHLEDESAMPSK